MPEMPEFRATAGEALRDVLARLEGDPARFAHKWRGDVLLIEWFGWWAYEKDHIAWSSIKEIRSACRANGDRLPIAMAMKASTQLTPGQVSSNHPLLPGADTLVRRRALLAGLAPYRTGLLGRAGCLLDAPLAALLGPQVAGRIDLADGNQQRVRLLPVTDAQRGSATRYHDLQIRTASGTWVSIIGLEEPSWQASPEYAPVRSK